MKFLILHTWYCKPRWGKANETCTFLQVWFKHRQKLKRKSEKFLAPLTQQMLQLVILNQTLQLSRVINQTAFRIHFCMYRFVIGFNFSLGTGKFIRENGNVLSQEETLAITECNKDTSGRKTLQSWSRGVFLVVSRGGHIEYWQPLYR